MVVVGEVAVVETDPGVAFCPQAATTTVKVTRLSAALIDRIGNPSFITTGLDDPEVGGVPEVLGGRPTAAEPSRMAVYHPSSAAFVDLGPFASDILGTQWERTSNTLTRREDRISREPAGPAEGSND